jgi:DNA-directed RNA polymerase specialized sigma24 family protein
MAPHGDNELVQRSLLGDRYAFEQLIARYQSLICSLAYSATGNLGQSEDLAQETFITAWKRLGHLREQHRLRAWLCGIARNRINNLLRREGREPLILFYREHQSIETVAAHLELSEDAARQRLARGRTLLQEQVLAFVEGALKRSNPGKAFTVAVVASLPALAVSAHAAAIGATAAAGSATTKTLGAASLLHALLGPLIVIVPNYVAYRVILAGARSAEERAEIKLNKGEEVIQRLSKLIDHQDAQLPQPQFAQSYLVLGDQYLKMGQPDHAAATWQIGARKFPGFPELQRTITGN